METRNLSRSRFVETLEKAQLHDHLCLLYQTQEEQLATIVPLVRGSLERGYRCLYLADDTPPATILEALARAGIDTEAALGRGALQIGSARDIYLAGGSFDSENMIRLLEESVAAAKKAGFAALCVSGEMTWALQHDPGSNRLLEYEAKLNRFFADHDIIGLCQYDCRRFPPSIIRDVIRTHPLIVYDDIVCHNPYYVPPEEFLSANGCELEVPRLLFNLRHRQLAEERLQDFVAQFQTILDTTCDGFLVLDQDQNILEINNAYGALSGYSRAELLHMNIADLRAAETPAQIVDCFRLIREKGSARFETRHRTKDGNIIDVEVSSTFVSRTNRFVNFIRDVSARKQTEAKLRQSVREIETLLKEVHHRVKNNLAIIVALLNLQSESIQDSACREVLRESQNRVYAMATVHQMLKQLQILQGMDLGAYVRDLCQHLIRAYVNDPSQVQLKIQVDPVTLGIDIAVPFGLILNELVSNALKHAFPLSRPGQLQVSVQAQADGPVRLVVQDDGIGLPAELDFPHARSLGLRLVNSLARQIGGTVAIEKNNGTTVRVTFTPGENRDWAKGHDKD